MLKTASAYYLRKPRSYRHGDISVVVAPTVFPPFITISTKIMLRFAESLPLSGKSFLELGCGCGIISVLAAKKGAVVTATDINKAALLQLEKNAAANNVSIDILYSDLFESLVGKTFDYIFINPPYYPKDPKTIAENAWFCGKDFEYFERLFVQLSSVIHRGAEIYMILSEECNIESILLLAEKSGLSLCKKRFFQIWGEKNFLFLITAPISS